MSVPTRQQYRKVAVVSCCVRESHETCTLMSIGCKRRILDIKWSHFICNIDIEAASASRPCLRLRRLRLFVRTARAPDSIPAKNIQRATFVTVSASLLIARDCENVARYLATSNNQGLRSAEPLQLAMNRSVWRSYVTAISDVGYAMR